MAAAKLMPCMEDELASLLFWVKRDAFHDAELVDCDVITSVSAIESKMRKA